MITGSLPVTFLFFLLFFFSPAAAQGGGAPERKLWCVAKNNAGDAALQSAVDWACGQGGADCGTIQQNGSCYDAADLRRTASFVFNDYFLKHGPSDENCNFGNTAALTTLDPSHGNCTFPSSSGGRSFSGATVDSGVSPDLNITTSMSENWDCKSLAFHLSVAMAVLIL